MIGFVVPSIGRDSIKYTLQSLINQTDPNWKCWVGFDGKCEEDIDKNNLIEDSRINYLYFKDKLGVSAHHGNAGYVRNSIISHITEDCDWIGFVDDDDTLSKFYIEILELEKTKSEFNCCVFRMRYDKDNQKVIPPFGMNHLQQNYVGISFCVSKKFIAENNIKFTNDNAEDFKFLKEINDKGGKIYISPHITYNVNGHSYG
jgi:glycosyltransferase involved in cell wall biosynthesis